MHCPEDACRRLSRVRQQIGARRAPSDSPFDNDLCPDDRSERIRPKEGASDGRDSVRCCGEPWNDWPEKAPPGLHYRFPVDRSSEALDGGPALDQRIAQRRPSVVEKFLQPGSAESRAHERCDAHRPDNLGREIAGAMRAVLKSLFSRARLLPGWLPCGSGEDPLRAAPIHAGQSVAGAP